MDIAAKMEMHFYSEKEAAIWVDSNAPESGEKLVYLFWFIAYVVRQIILMRPDGEHAQAVARTFGSIASEKTHLSGLVAELNRDSVRIIRYPGHEGRKGFRAQFECSAENPMDFKSRIKPYGFGFLGQGINSYAMLSVLLFLRYIYGIIGEDSAYQDALAEAVTKCGNIFVTGYTPSVAQEREFIQRIFLDALEKGGLGGGE